MSLVLSGRYDWPNGQTKFQDGDGNWWGSNTQNQWNSYDLGVHQTLLDPERLHDNRYGFALRCVKRLYGSTSARSYPVSLVLSGEYLWGGGEQYRGKVYEQNTGGYWWTSLSGSNSDFANYAGTDSDELSQFSNTKTYGFPLRCVNPYNSTSARSYQMFLMSFDKLFVQGEYYYSSISLHQSSK